MSKEQSRNLNFTFSCAKLGFFYDASQEPCRCPPFPRLSPGDCGVSWAGTEQYSLRLANV